MLQNFVFLYNFKIMKSVCSILLYYYYFIYVLYISRHVKTIINNYNIIDKTNTGCKLNYNHYCRSQN